MVTILEFRRPESSDPGQQAESEAPAFAEGHTAEVIIFPGVRIERQSPEGSDEDSHSSANRAEHPGRSK